MGKFPGVQHAHAVRAFQPAGFEVIRQSGHVVMSDGQRTLIEPRDKPINAMTMFGIIKGAGLTLDQFRKLL